MNIQLSQPARIVLLLVAILAAIGPNALYLFAVITDPGLNQQAMQNPVALAFMIEAMMLLALFLWFVYHRTRSFVQVLVYFVLTFLGSLAFSFPLFLFLQSKRTT